LVNGGPSSTTGVAFLRAAMGMIGAVAGIAAVMRFKNNP
jgi:hypothetical protein